MGSLDLDTPALAKVREHLLRLARASIEPQHGAWRAQEGSPEEDAVMDRFRPFAELLLLVAAADGHIDDVERAAIWGAFRAITGGRVRGLRLEALEAQVRSRITDGDPEALLEDVCTALAGDKRDAELALTLASAVALADKVVDPGEVALIRTLASWLSIPDARISVLVGGEGAGPAS